MTSKTKFWLGLAIGVICLAFVVSMSAQVKTETETAAGAATKTMQVVNAEVVYVNGNDLVLKMEDGSLRHITNVPASARATVDGQEIGIADVKPGMKLQKTIVTTTTPKVVTTTQTVTGKVWHVSPPSSVILTLEDGTNQQFKIPKGQKFNVEGQMVDAFGLKKGMKVSATKVVEVPVTEVEKQAKLTGSMPPPPPPPPPDQPIIIAQAEPTPAPAPAPEAPKELPKTSSPLPLIGLFGFLSLVSSLGLKAVRFW
jgi:hypothetical protein